MPVLLNKSTVEMGGFSAAGGVETKGRMLELERKFSHRI